MTRAGTKTTMKRQPVKKTKMDKVYEDVQKFTKDKKIADALIAKYGVDCAYAIVRQCMQEPANVVKRINSKSAIWKTGDAITYFAQSTLTDEAIAKGIKKTQAFVKTSKNSKDTTLRAETSQIRFEQRTVSTRLRTVPTKQQTVPTKQQTVLKRRDPIAPIPQPLTPKWGLETLESPFKIQPVIKTLDEQVADEIARLKKENPNGVTLGTLKEEGFTAGINNKVITPDKFKYLHSSKDGKGLGSAVKAATKGVVGKDQCGAAVRIGYTNYMNRTYNLNVPKNEAEFYGKRVNGKLEWGSQAAEVLYKKFDPSYFTVLSYPNNGTNKELSNVPDGTTIFYEGKKGRKLDSGAQHPGHTATYCAEDNCWYAGSYHQDKSKINNGSGYGKNYRLAIANDTKVDDTLLEEIIREQVKQNEKNNERTNYVVRAGGRG